MVLTIVCCIPKLSFKPKTRKKFKVGSFHSVEVKANFQAVLQSRLKEASDLTDSFPETLWEKLKTRILLTSVEVIGFSSKKNKDCFEGKNMVIQELPVKKKSTHQGPLAQPSRAEKKAAFRMS